MRKMVFFFLISINMFAQNTFKILITDEHSGEPLPGVNILVLNSTLGASTNEDGFAEIKNIPDGMQNIKISYIGYEEQILTLNFPLSNGETIELKLEEEAEELEEISVSSTRSSRLIDDEPTRVEVIAGEEMEEKINMDPSSISMVLNESTGIQVQQTSAASVNSTFRIQGLEGRFTQLLRDGFPLYSGYSGSLSINQIPPLDLKQIEVIKGSSSTLYGGGAIAGLINLISKEPQEKRDISLLLNGTTATGLDLSGYYSEKYENIGLSIFASHNSQQSYDNNDDKFTDLPETDRYTINPKIYFYLSEKSTLMIGASLISEGRTGGYIPAIEDRVDTAYTEENKSGRYSTQLRFDLKMDEGTILSFKNSFGYFEREILLPSYSFEGNQLSSFSELTYTINNEGMEWIFGLNLNTSSFDDKSGNEQNHSFSHQTFGAFLQNTVDLSDIIAFESGFRTDYNNKYGWFALPRLSLLIEWTDKLTSRLGGGLGYKLPEVFTEKAEELNFRNIDPLPQGELQSEKSYGLNFDLNYKTIIADEVTLSINNLFFYTRITDPVILVNNVQG
ncbi:MAG: TonB-dependent receptor, partial [Ignavibacteriaceae bacterium]